MKTKEIIAGDEAIAKYLNLEPCMDPNCANDRCYDMRSLPEYKAFGIGYRKVSELKFSTSWDWLMPVIKKITESRPEPYWYDIEHCLLRGDIADAHNRVSKYCLRHNKIHNFVHGKKE